MKLNSFVRLIATVAFGCAAAAGVAGAKESPQIAAVISAAVDSPDRPEADRKLDAARKPKEMLAFFGVKPGMKLVDLFTGRGWYAELEARVAGPGGEVYAQNPPEFLQKYGDKWTHSLAINDLYFDFMGPSLAAAGKKGDAAPKNISAGDGSESAFQRIRAKQYQDGTVPEPLNMQGWQLVDELNRAFNKQPWSGYTSGIHLVTADNVAFDGGDKNVFDPDNGYRDQYKKIWGAK